MKLRILTAAAVAAVTVFALSGCVSGVPAVSEPVPIMSVKLSTVSDSLRTLLEETKKHLGGEWQLRTDAVDGCSIGDRDGGVLTLMDQRPSSADPESDAKSVAAFWKAQGVTGIESTRPDPDNYIGWEVFGHTDYAGYLHYGAYNGHDSLRTQSYCALDDLTPTTPEP